MERAFRCLKTIDLEIRPIYHRRADRVASHVFLCMLAYYMEWRLRQKLAPLLFDDHDRAAAARDTIVSPAVRSPAAQAKDRIHPTAAGQPVPSFRTLLANLATLCRHRVRLAGGAATFDLLTQPKPHQSALFALLGITP